MVYEDSISTTLYSCDFTKNNYYYNNLDLFVFFISEVKMRNHWKSARVKDTRDGLSHQEVQPRLQR